MKNLLILFILLSFHLSAQNVDKKDEKTKSYNSIINNEVTTDQGLFKVHKKGDEYYYEIHPSQLNLEMLMVTRIAKTINGIGYGEQKINSQVLRWQKKNYQILLRIVSYENIASDSLPIYESVRNSNFEPILYAFEIETHNPEDSSVLINVSPLFNTGNYYEIINRKNNKWYRIRWSKIMIYIFLSLEEFSFKDYFFRQKKIFY